MRRLASFAFAALFAVPTFAADMGGRAPAPVEVALPSSPGLPACDDPRVLGDIVERQNWAEANTWQDGVRIETISDVRQATPFQRFSQNVEHRHCAAQASFGPNRGDALYYVISRRMGFASISWYVDFCMPRHDPYRVYDAGCRVLR
jgi:hypothetical protein